MVRECLASVGQTIVFRRLPPGVANPLRMHPLALGGNCLGHRSLRINARVEKAPPAPVRVLAAWTRHWLFLMSCARRRVAAKTGSKNPFNSRPGYRWQLPGPSQLAHQCQGRKKRRLRRGLGARRGSDPRLAVFELRAT
jgi:hypothetical protein